MPCALAAEVVPPVALPTTNVFPSVENNPAALLLLLLPPTKFPLMYIVPADDLLMQCVLVPGPPVKLLPVIIKSQLPV